MDEPTTNLDEENARSLALMLQQIIRDRSQQRNFQLIVIHHDEKFAQMIGRRTFCEHYWYVHKDENQHSKILRQEVLERAGLCACEKIKQNKTILPANTTTSSGGFSSGRGRA